MALVAMTGSYWVVAWFWRTQGYPNWSLFVLSRFQVIYHKLLDFRYGFINKRATLANRALKERVR
jgi:hypothetical protein